MNVRTLSMVFLLSAGLATPGCKKEEKSEPAKQESATKEQAEKTPEPKDAPEGDAAAPENAVEAVMKPYEECRALLAADKAEGISDCAGKVAAAAKAAVADAPEAAKQHLEAIRSAAEALASAAADDVEKLRLAYGEVSKPVVELLVAMPEAAKRFHIFECGMAKGYQRWAQLDKKMANPYMGTKMLECGTEVHDHHEAMMEGGHEGGGHMEKMGGEHHGAH